MHSRRLGKVSGFSSGGFEQSIEVPTQATQEVFWVVSNKFHKVHGFSREAPLLWFVVMGGCVVMFDRPFESAWRVVDIFQLLLQVSSLYEKAKPFEAEARCEASTACIWLDVPEAESLGGPVLLVLIQKLVPSNFEDLAYLCGNPRRNAAIVFSTDLATAPSRQTIPAWRWMTQTDSDRLRLTQTTDSSAIAQP
jgi:hypothetical protein